MQTATIVLLAALLAVMIAKWVAGVADTRKTRVIYNMALDEALTVLHGLRDQRVDEILGRLINVNEDQIKLGEYTHRLAHNMRDHMQTLVVTSEARHLENTKRLDAIELNLAAFLKQCEEDRPHGTNTAPITARGSKP